MRNQVLHDNNANHWTISMCMKLSENYSTIVNDNQIASIFNTLSRTGEKLRYLILHILRPLLKPGKAKGPLKNLRQIILLLTIRKSSQSAH